MITNKDAEIIIGWILTTGVVLSAVLVLAGGTMFLFQYGHEAMQLEWHQRHTYTNLQNIFQGVRLFSSTALIELGIVTLVATQLLRVGLLVVFYAVTRDYRFTLISTVVFVIMLYSLLYPHY